MKLKALAGMISVVSLLGVSSALGQSVANWSAVMKPEFRNYVSTPGPAVCHWYDHCYCRNCVRPYLTTFTLPVALPPR
jgi:hypothetical protein